MRSYSTAASITRQTTSPRRETASSRPFSPEPTDRMDVPELHMPPFTVQLFQHPGSIEYLHDAWETLAKASEQTLFMSPEWACRWWKHFGRHSQRSLYILYVQCEGKPAAIFPFYRGTTRVQHVILEQRLQLIGSGGNRNEGLGYMDDYGISDFLDFLVHPEYHSQIAGLYADLLRNTALGEHRIILQPVRSDSYIFTSISPLLTRQNCGQHQIQTDQCPYIALSDVNGFEDYLSQCKSNARRRFRQTLRAESYTIKAITTKLQLRAALRNLEKLHQTRWNEAGYPGLFADKRFKAFITDFTTHAFRTNQLWCKQVHDHEGVSAIRILFLYNNRLYDYLSGFKTDSPSASDRPGIALMLDALRECVHHKVHGIELLRGRETYKFDFTNREITNWKIDIPVQKGRSRYETMRSMSLQHCANLFKHTQRELRLLQVQYLQKGGLRMIPGYVQFRFPMLAKRLQKGA